MELKRLELNPFEIAFDKENPRDETQNQIENEPGFKKLKEHINQYGLFYPVGVKKEKVNGKEYVLVDGERRLRVSQSLKLEKIPVILVEGDFDKRILAYQLHMLGKSWSMKVRVKSINLIVSELKKEGKSEEDILKIVENLTKMPKEQIRDILKVLRYSKKVIKVIENKESYRTFLVESENNFVPLIKKNFLDLYKRYDENKLREIIGNKLLNKKLGATRSFRDLKDYLEKECKNKKMAEKRIESFLVNGDVEISQIKEGIEEDNKKEAKRIIEMVHTKKEIPQIDEEVIPKATNLKESFLKKEKILIQADIFHLIFNNFKESIKRYEQRSEIKIDNETKLQNFLYSILRCLFISVDFENPTSKICGTSNRMDLVIKDHKIVIEIKFVRNKEDHKRIFKELAEDYHKYSQTGYKSNMINYIYDPNNYISQNHTLFKKELDDAFRGTRNYIQ